MTSSYNSFNTFINQGRHGSDLIFKLLHVLSREDTTSDSCVLWSIWKQKNNKLWNDVIHAQPNLLFDWKAAQKVSQIATTLSSYIRNVKWIKPDSNVLLACLSLIITKELD